MSLVGGGAILHGVYETRSGEQGKEKERTPELLYERVGWMTSCRCGVRPAQDRRALMEAQQTLN